MITAARIVDGILKLVDEHIRTPTFGGPLTTDIGQNATNQIRQSINVPPRYETIEQLQCLGRDVIDNYFYYV